MELIRYKERVEEKYTMKLGKTPDFIDALKILDTNHKVSIPRKVELQKPNGKKRYVYLHTIEERMILSSLYMYFTDKYSHLISSNCYSYQKGKSTLTAIREINKDYTKRVSLYGLKVDISAYFDSVSKEVLYGTLDTVLKYEPQPIKDFVYQVYKQDKYSYKNQVHNKYLSLIQGCSMASFLSNIILKPLDDILSSRFKNLYSRYSDDLLVFCSSQEQVQETLEVIKQELDKLGLTLNPNKVEVYQPYQEITYLGLSLLPDGNIDMSKEAMRKFKKKIKAKFRYYNKNANQGLDRYKATSRFLKSIQREIYKPYIIDANKFGWSYYMFRYITITGSLRELDFYIKDTTRYLLSGRHHKSNFSQFPDDKIKSLGYVSLVELYNNFRYDIDYYYTLVYSL